ncbi:MAG: DNA repair protein RecN [Spirochaetales bacterium]|nr:DNA repair protein RecN [Spirochaetales bacterium]
MIEELVVRNYALIDSINLSFPSGFTVLSGETGAGKSILITALSALAGAKVDGNVVRSGKDEAEISGVINIGKSSEAQAMLAEMAIEPEDGCIQLRRKISASGRSQMYIQGTPVNRSSVVDLTSLLFDMHGQHEHQALLSPENQRKLLDRYAGHEEKVLELGTRFVELTNLKKRYAELNRNEQDRARELDFLKFAVREIEETKLVAGEEEELEQELQVLNQFESVFSAVSNFIQSSAENSNGALSGLRAGIRELSAVAEINKELYPLLQRTEDAFYELEDVVEQVKDYKAGLHFDPGRIDACAERLQIISRLKKKYGNGINEIITYKNEAQEKITDLENWESNKSELVNDIARLEKEVLSMAGEISAKRQETAKTLEKGILVHLKDLGMPESRFEIRISRKETENGRLSCGPRGFDAIDFYISPNKGEPLKPLKAIASGGEMSRIMLALKSVLAGSDQVQTMIFDEIDAGIGGAVALAVGEKIRQISSDKQIICITHLASIAVRADNHIKVEKKVAGERTITQIQSLRNNEKVTEIARMLSGDSGESASIAHARELLEKYGPLKKQELPGWQK